MMPTEYIQEFRSVSAWNVSFVHSLHASLQSGQVAELINHWLDQAFKRERSLSTMQDFRQSSEAVVLSQFS